MLAEAGGEALAFGPSLLTASARPGEAGISIIAAHRDTHFRFLRHVEPGQTVIIERADAPPLAFRVTGSEIVEAARSGIETNDGGPARLALVTCWPFDAVTPGPLRYVVWAEPVAVTT